MKDILVDVFVGNCKVKSVGYLNLNGIIVDVYSLDENILLDRRYMIVEIKNLDDYFDISNGYLEFGFVLRFVMIKFRD